MFTDDDSYRESELAITRQGAPYHWYSSSSSDRTSNSASENSVNTWFSAENIICDARPMPSLARFLANIRPHFDQLRSDAHAVVCMDKSLFAITADFGKACSQFPNIPRIWRIWRMSQYTPTNQGSYIRPIYTKYTKCIWRIVDIRLRGVAMPNPGPILAFQVLYKAT